MARRRNTGKYAGLYGGDARGLYSSSAHRNMMIYGKAPRRWPKVMLVIVILLIAAACVWQFACGGLPFINAMQEEEAQDQMLSGSAQTTSTEATDEDSSALSDEEYENGTYQEGLDTTITLSALGDCTLGTEDLFSSLTNFTAVYDANSTSYFFANVLPVTSADDLTVANLEGPLTESEEEAEGKTYNFHGSPEYTKILTKGSVEAVNLANNHSYDYGEDGYEDTKENLEDAGISNFGYDRVATTTVNGITVGLFGINQLSQSDPETVMLEDIEQLKEAGCALIVGVFHWGVELDYEPSDEQVELAHAAIDAGCDVVLGTHPHVLQGIELYNDRYICYSLGNFCFGGNDDPSDYDTMIFQQTFTFEDGWLVMDDAALSDVSVVPCSVSSSESINNYQPTPLTGDAATSVLEKLNSGSEALSGTSVLFASEVEDDGYAYLDDDATGSASSEDSEESEESDESASSGE